MLIVVFFNNQKQYVMLIDIEMTVLDKMMYFTYIILDLQNILSMTVRDAVAHEESDGLVV